MDPARAYNRSATSSRPGTVVYPYQQRHAYANLHNVRVFKNIWDAQQNL